MFFNIETFKLIGISFLIATLAGYIVIPMLRKLEARQNVRKAGPKSHYKKSGTPTMGGFIFGIGLILTLLITRNINGTTVVLLFSTLGFGLVGFLDDILIIIKKDNEGLKPRQKLLGQIIVALALVLYKYNISGGEMIVPFMGGRTINIGMFYVPFLLFVVVGTVNSVNLTDGLDGLASGVTAIVMIFLGVISISLNQASIYRFSVILAGSCLGFLVHNIYPAKVFMGDTGSLALGGAVSGITLLLDLPLIIPIIGGIYLMEALSVIIQVIGYKHTGKRILLMAPLHHHFEQKGWREIEITLAFWMITLVLGFISVYSIM